MSKKKISVSNSFIIVVAIIAVIWGVVILSARNTPSISNATASNAAAGNTRAAVHDNSEIGSGATQRVVRITSPRGVITAQISDRPAMREQGLSGRPLLEASQGMLFIFDRPGIYGFWMKDMRFPLDMIWMDAAHKVVAIDSNVAPSTYPNSYFPPMNISYVLEMNAGAAKNFGIEKGVGLVF